MDSCDLLNQMEMADCPIKAASKSLVSTGETDSSQKPLPPLIACTYSTGKSVMPVTCYTKESAELWAMAKFGGEWAAKLKEKGLSLDKMINICPASGNYYVSQSLAKSAVTF
jgi:hypothetical protein